MKAHDSWPGNKAEEGRLPNGTHIRTSLKTLRLTHRCIWDLTQHRACVVRQAYGP